MDLTTSVHIDSWAHPEAAAYEPREEDVAVRVADLEIRTRWARPICHGESLEGQFDAETFTLVGAPAISAVGHPNASIDRGNTLPSGQRPAPRIEICSVAALRRRPRAVRSRVLPVIQHDVQDASQGVLALWRNVDDDSVWPAASASVSVASVTTANDGKPDLTHSNFAQRNLRQAMSVAPEGARQNP